MMHIIHVLFTNLQQMGHGSTTPLEQTNLQPPTGPKLTNLTIYNYIYNKYWSLGGQVLYYTFPNH